MIDYENRKKEIGKRIRRLREAFGLTRQEFLTKIYKSEKSHKTLLAWEDGERLPDLTSLSRMADLFKCDIGYLLCDYDQHTSTIADISEATGLSEVATSKLLRISSDIKRNRAAGWSTFSDERELKALNCLLEHDYSILLNIYEYLFSSYDSFSLLTNDETGDDKDIFDKDVLLCNKSSPQLGGIYLSIDKMQSVFMLEIQNGLIELRNQLHPSKKKINGRSQTPKKE